MIFLKLAGGWILRNPAILLCGVLCAAFVMIVLSKNSEIAGLEKQIYDPKTGYATRLSRADAGLATARGSVATLNSALTTQNASINDLKNKAALADAKFDTTMARLTGQISGYNAKIAVLANAKPGENKCDSAFALTRSIVK